ncbi:MAG: type IV pilin protein [Candidatus Omnitrophica bacterium]|nr:type IV pilin protein [Candidatus Omnitrophota bacterium]
MNKKNSAFTMLEVMVVVVVIGILVGIAVPAYMTAVERSRASKAVNNLKALQSAQNHYFSAAETYTNQLVLLGAEVGADFVAMDNSDTDWAYSVPAVAVTTFTLQATRTGGPHNTKTLTVTQDDVWGGTYPL